MCTIDIKEKEDGKYRNQRLFLKFIFITPNQNFKIYS